MMEDKNEECSLTLRPWLKLRIESSEFPCITWKCQKEKTFQILWADKNKDGWPEFFKLCQAWSDHKNGNGKAKSYSNPKSKFRDALRNSNYFEELKDQHVSSRQSGNYKVYRILTAEEAQEKKEMKKSKNNSQPTEDSSEQDSQESVMDVDTMICSIDNQLDIFMNPFNGSVINSTPNSQDTIHSEPTVAQPSYGLLLHDANVSNPPPFLTALDPHEENAVESAASEPKQQLITQPSCEDLLTAMGVDCKMLSQFTIMLIYDNNTIEQKVFDFSSGYRIVADELVRSEFRPDEWKTVPLPPYLGGNSQVEEVLEKITDGIVLQYVAGSGLHGIRMGKAHINYSNCDCEGESFVNMDKNKETVLFSYSNYRTQAISYRFLCKHQPICYVILSFGKHPSHRSSRLPVGMIIEPVLAQFLKETFDVSSGKSDNILCSDDSSLDEQYKALASQFKHLVSLSS